MTTFFVGKSARSKLAHNQDNEFHAIVSFSPPAMDESERAPLDIAVALDHSGSMAGDKLAAAKQSLLKLVEHLGPRDTLGLATFESTVEVVFEPLAMDEDGKRKAQELVAQIHAASCTNLSGGLFKALDFLKALSKDEGRVRKCLLFTDGLANRGVTDTDQLTEAALEYRAGLGISTFGYGSDHNPKLLAAIAQDGNFYYVDNPDRILHAFGTELGGLVSTYAQNVEVTLAAGDGVKIAEVLDDLTVTDDVGDGKRICVGCDDLLAELPYHVCLRLTADKRNKVLPRETTLVSATAKYVNLVSRQSEEQTCAVKATFVKAEDASTEDDKDVMKHVALHQVAQAQAQAEIHAQRGDFTMARLCLNDVSDAVKSYNPDMGQMALGLSNEAYASERMYRASGEKLSSSVKKGLTRQRAGVGGQSVGGVDFDKAYGNVEQKSAAANFTSEPEPAPEPPKPTPPPEEKRGVSKKRSARW